MANPEFGQDTLPILQADTSAVGRKLWLKRRDLPNQRGLSKPVPGRVRDCPQHCAADAKPAAVGGFADAGIIRHPTAFGGFTQEPAAVGLDGRIFFGREPLDALRGTTAQRLRTAAYQLFDRLGVDVADPDRPVRELPLAQRHLVLGQRLAGRLRARAELLERRLAFAEIGAEPVGSSSARLATSAVYRAL